MSLAPPVEPMLARAVLRLSGPAALPGGTALEPKYDGFRLLVFVGADGEVFLQSRNRRDLTGAFPEIADAAAAPGEDVVIDGEAVIHTGGRLDFSALQHRMNRRPRTVALLAREQPAHLVTGVRTGSATISEGAIGAICLVGGRCSRCPSRV